MLSKYAVHPASHNWPRESNDPDANLLNKCTCLACRGRDGTSSVAVCVAWSMMPSGYLTLTPLTDG